MHPSSYCRTPADELKSSSGTAGAIKLLQVSAEPVFNLGGVGLIVLRLIKGFPAAYRVDLACPDAGSARVPGEVRDRIEQLFAVPAAKWSAADRAEFIERTRAGDYDLIHLHGGTFSFDAHLAWRSPLGELSRLRIPWVFSNHCAPTLTTGLFPKGYPLPLKVLKMGVAFSSLAWLTSGCARQIFDSRENQERIAKCLPWAKRKLMTIYHSGLEGKPPEVRVREPAITIGNLGHIAWRKGQYDLLDAFSLLRPKFPQLKLLLVGPEDGGDCAARIKAEIANRNLADAVSMPGGTNDPATFWEQIDIYVQPAHYEGAPMALMEALWHGKPSVGTRVSGIPEIIEDGVSGLLVEAKNPPALAAAIERLLRDAELRKRLASSGPRQIQAKGMTHPQMIQRHLDLYTELLARRARAQ